MKSSDRVLLTYAATLLGTGVFNYWRGQRGTELAKSMAVQTAVLGTGANVALWLAQEQTTPPALLNPLGGLALPNGDSFTGMGKLSAEAVNFLSEVNPEAVVKSLKTAAVRFGKVPSNPYVVDMNAVK